MKIIMLAVVLLSSAVVYAGEPYVKTFYKNKNWTVMQVGKTGESKQCTLRSSPHYLDSGKNPKYGTTYLEIGYPNNIVTFSGENIGVYFRIAKQARLQVDDGKSVAINPKTPITAKSIIDSFIKGKAVKIEIDFESGDPSIHTFSLLGFTKAYKKLVACSGITITMRGTFTPYSLPTFTGAFNLTSMSFFRIYTLLITTRCCSALRF